MNIYPFLVYMVVTTFTPGPNNILAMSNAVQVGYKKTLGFLAGVFSGFAVVMLVCGLLNVILVNLLPQVKFWLNLLGAAYMLYLAIHVLRSKPTRDESSPSALNSYWGGFSVQFLNLKVILYGITIYANFIVPAYPEAQTAALFAPLLAGVGFISTSCWALGGDLFRKWLKRYARWFNLAMAALLAYTAIASLL
jgi:threonine/homoserine/homoserine lactone efflux protein